MNGTTKGLMGKRDRERRERLISGERRIKESGLPNAIERYRDLAKMSGCTEADKEQALMALTMGADWQPIECPHCGDTPTIGDLVKDRPECAVIGHPEQALFAQATGRAPVPCILCGETPDASSDESPFTIEGERSILTLSSPSPDHPDTCPNGHPEQMARVMAGLSPVRCERCGEIPQFSPMESGSV